MRLMTNRDSFRSVIVPLLAKAEHIKKVVVTLWEHVLKNVKKKKHRLMLEQFLKNWSLWEGCMLEQFVKDCILWEGPPHAEMREKDEGVSETNWLHFHPLALLRDEEVEETRVKPDLGSIWQDGQEGIFVFVFTVHHPTLLLIGNKLIFPQVCFACGFNWWMILSLSQPTRFVLFSPLSCWRREGRDSWLSSQD